MAGEATEICLLFINSWQPYSWWPCMSKSEWAYWVQAFGSIAAILGSAYVSRYQFMKVVVTKKNNAGDLLLEFFIAFNYFFDSFNLFKENFEKGRLSHQEIRKMKIYVDEISSVLKSIKLEDLSSEWAMSCVQARVHINVLQAIFESIDNLLEKKFSDVAFFSPKAAINLSDQKIDEECKSIYFEVVIMNEYAVSLSESILGLGRLTHDNKKAQLRKARSKGLYHYFDYLNK